MAILNGRLCAIAAASVYDEYFCNLSAMHLPEHPHRAADEFRFIERGYDDADAQKSKFYIVACQQSPVVFKVPNFVRFPSRFFKSVLV